MTNYYFTNIYTMKKSFLLLFVAFTAIIKTAEAQYTGTEWEVKNYPSVFGKTILVKLEPNQHKSVFFLNEKGKLIQIEEIEMALFVSGNTVFQCKGIDTVKKKSFVRLETDNKQFFLFINPKEENEYLKSMRNMSVYDSLVSECNKNFTYAKKTTFDMYRLKKIGDFSNIDFNNFIEVANIAYEIQWTGFDCGFPNIYANAKGFVQGKTKRYEITIPINKLKYSDYFTEQQITEIKERQRIEEERRREEEERMRKIEEEQNALLRRIDSIEDTKYHAYILTRDIADREEGDTIFMFSYNQGWIGGDVINIYDPDALKNVHVSNGSDMFYSEYKAYIQRRNGEGEEQRRELARQRDSLSNDYQLDQLVSILKEIRSYYDELNAKKIFLIDKEYAYGDYSYFGLKLTFYNCFKKTIKYINFETKSYNKFGDLQKDYVGKVIAKGRCVGPLEPEEEASWTFDELYYDKNDMIERVCVTKVTFTFLDNSTLTYTDINNHKTKDVYNKNK